MQFVPFRYDGDRGVALEEAWKENLGGALEVPFKSLAVGEKEGWRPSLIVTPMLVEDGRQLIISNLFLHFMTENAGAYGAYSNTPTGPNASPPQTQQFAQRRPRSVGREPPAGGTGDSAATPDPHRYSLSGLEFFQLFPDAESRFMLGTAARMNASFPYVSPAVDLPVRPRRRAVDAGYYDNYGVKTASAWIYHNRDWIEQHTSGVVLIQVTDEASDDRRLSPGDETSTSAQERDMWDWSRGVEWLTGPLVGAASARASVMSFRNDEQLEGLSDFFNAAPGRSRFFTTVVFSCPRGIATDWYLGPAINDKIKAGWTAARNKDALAELKSWWESQPAPKARR
jgi:hypothetical protein